uniref:Zn(2)-C6 fungal-type domain-containing protein n=1 Tax=Caenorhabditis tropicalis TaxID=1561998 RepID=A0A1I7TII5_9PELO
MVLFSVKSSPAEYVPGVGPSIRRFIRLDMPLGQALQEVPLGAVAGQLRVQKALYEKMDGFNGIGIESASTAGVGMESVPIAGVGIPSSSTVGTPIESASTVGQSLGGESAPVQVPEKKPAPKRKKPTKAETEAAGGDPNAEKPKRKRAPPKKKQKDDDEPELIEITPRTHQQMVFQQPVQQPAPQALPSVANLLPPISSFKKNAPQQQSGYGVMNNNAMNGYRYSDGTAAGSSSSSSSVYSSYDYPMKTLTEPPKRHQSMASMLKPLAGTSEFIEQQAAEAQQPGTSNHTYSNHINQQFDQQQQFNVDHNSYPSSVAFERRSSSTDYYGGYDSLATNNYQTSEYPPQSVESHISCHSRDSNTQLSHLSSMPPTPISQQPNNGSIYNSMPVTSDSQRSQSNGHIVPQPSAYEFDAEEFANQYGVIETRSTVSPVIDGALSAYAPGLSEIQVEDFFEAMRREQTPENSDTTASSSCAANKHSVRSEISTPSDFLSNFLESGPPSNALPKEQPIEQEQRNCHSVPNDTEFHNSREPVQTIPHRVVKSSSIGGQPSQSYASVQYVSKDSAPSSVQQIGQQQPQKQMQIQDQYFKPEENMAVPHQFSQNGNNFENGHYNRFGQPANQPSVSAAKPPPAVATAPPQKQTNAKSVDQPPKVPRPGENLLPPDDKQICYVQYLPNENGLHADGQQNSWNQIEGQAPPPVPAKRGQSKNRKKKKDLDSMPPRPEIHAESPVGQVLKQHSAMFANNHNAPQQEQKQNQPGTSAVMLSPTSDMRYNRNHNNDFPDVFLEPARPDTVVESIDSVIASVMRTPPKEQSAAEREEFNRVMKAVDSKMNGGSAIITHEKIKDGQMKSPNMKAPAASQLQQMLMRSPNQPSQHLNHQSSRQQNHGNQPHLQQPGMQNAQSQNGQSAQSKSANLQQNARVEYVDQMQPAQGHFQPPTVPRDMQLESHGELPSKSAKKPRSRTTKKMQDLVNAAKGMGQNQQMQNGHGQNQFVHQQMLNQQGQNQQLQNQQMQNQQMQNQQMQNQQLQNGHGPVISVHQHLKNQQAQNQKMQYHQNGQQMQQHHVQNQIQNNQVRQEQVQHVQYQQNQAHQSSHIQNQQNSNQQMQVQTMQNQQMSNQQVQNQRMQNQQMQNQQMQNQQMQNQQMQNQQMQNQQMQNQGIQNRIPNQQMPNQGAQSQQMQGRQMPNQSIQSQQIQNQQMRNQQMDNQPMYNQQHQQMQSQPMQNQRGNFQQAQQMSNHQEQNQQVIHQQGPNQQAQRQQMSNQQMQNQHAQIRHVDAHHGQQEQNNQGQVHMVQYQSQPNQLSQDQHNQQLFDQPAQKPKKPRIRKSRAKPKPAAQLVLEQYQREQEQDKQMRMQTVQQQQQQRNQPMPAQQPLPSINGMSTQSSTMETGQPQRVQEKVPHCPLLQAQLLKPAVPLPPKHVEPQVQQQRQQLSMQNHQQTMQHQQSSHVITTVPLATQKQVLAAHAQQPKPVPRPVVTSAAFPHGEPDILRIIKDQLANESLQQPQKVQKVSKSKPPKPVKPVRELTIEPPEEISSFQMPPLNPVARAKRMRSLIKEIAELPSFTPEEYFSYGNRQHSLDEFMEFHMKITKEMEENPCPAEIGVADVLADPILEPALHGRFRKRLAAIQEGRTTDTTFKKRKCTTSDPVAKKMKTQEDGTTDIASTSEPHSTEHSLSDQPIYVGSHSQPLSVSTDLNSFNSSSPSTDVMLSSHFYASPDRNPLADSTETLFSMAHANRSPSRKTQTLANLNSVSHHLGLSSPPFSPVLMGDDNPHSSNDKYDDDDRGLFDVTDDFPNHVIDINSNNNPRSCTPSVGILDDINTVDASFLLIASPYSSLELHGDLSLHNCDRVSPDLVDPRHLSQLSSSFDSVVFNDSTQEFDTVSETISPTNHFAQEFDIDGDHDESIDHFVQEYNSTNGHRSASDIFKKDYRNGQSPSNSILFGDDTSNGQCSSETLNSIQQITASEFLEAQYELLDDEETSIDVSSEASTSNVFHEQSEHSGTPCKQPRINYKTIAKFQVAEIGLGIDERNRGSQNSGSNGSSSVSETHFRDKHGFVLERNDRQQADYKRKLRKAESHVSSESAVVKVLEKIREEPSFFLKDRYDQRYPKTATGPKVFAEPTLPRRFVSQWPTSTGIEELTRPQNSH